MLSASKYNCRVIYVEWVDKNIIIISIDLYVQLAMIHKESTMKIFLNGHVKWPLLIITRLPKLIRVQIIFTKSSSEFNIGYVIL